MELEARFIIKQAHDLADAENITIDEALTALKIARQEKLINQLENLNKYLAQ